MNAEHLNKILCNWSSKNSLPKVLYTIPNGSNPSGTSMSLDRKKDIYNVLRNIFSIFTINNSKQFRLLKNII